MKKNWIDTLIDEFTEEGLFHPSDQLIFDAHLEGMDCMVPLDAIEHARKTMRTFEWTDDEAVNAFTWKIKEATIIGGKKQEKEMCLFVRYLFFNSDMVRKHAANMDRGRRNRIELFFAIVVEIFSKYGRRSLSTPFDTGKWEER